VQRCASAACHTCNIIQHCIRLPLILKQLDVRVKKITFRNVYSFGENFVHQLNHPGSNGGFAYMRRVQKQPL
jgi:hypothetical protein